jgi:hypothetical protein
MTKQAVLGSSSAKNWPNPCNEDHRHRNRFGKAENTQGKTLVA